MGTLASSLSFAGLLVGAALTSAQSPPSLFSPSAADQLNSQLRHSIELNNLPSVEVSIVNPAKGSFRFVAGSADFTRKQPRKPNQPFRIASITKPFAATAILVLVEQGKLRKTDVIGKWYPSFPNADRITIDDLLRMRSGIPAPNDDEVLARVYDHPLAPAPSFAKEMRSYEELRSKFKAPDTVGVYTDFNYDILADIAERVTKKNIGLLITENVIQPLKLMHTSYPISTSVPGGLRGYGWNQSTNSFEDKTLFNPPLAGAAGAVISDARDLHTFARAVCRGTLLTPQTSIAQLNGKPLEGTNANYGEGIAVGSGVCGHSGTIDGYSSDMYYFDKLDTSVVINVNRLDRDNKSQSTAILDLVSKFLLASQPAN
jgi:D-alanyl-D-alanine carboxypeptidase